MPALVAAVHGVLSCAAGRLASVADAGGGVGDAAAQYAGDPRLPRRSPLQPAHGLGERSRRLRDAADGLREVSVVVAACVRVGAVVCAAATSSGLATLARGLVESRGEVRRAGGRLPRLARDRVESAAELAGAGGEPPRAVGELRRTAGERGRAVRGLLRAVGELVRAVGGGAELVAERREAEEHVLEVDLRELVAHEGCRGRWSPAR